jgi:hypothetical protein
MGGGKGAQRLGGLAIFLLLTACTSTSVIRANKSDSYKGETKRLFIEASLGNALLNKASGDETAIFTSTLINTLSKCGTQADIHFKNSLELPDSVGQRIKRFSPDSLLQITWQKETRQGSSIQLYSTNYILTLIDIKSRSVVWKAELDFVSRWSAGVTLAGSIIDQMRQDGLISASCAVRTEDSSAQPHIEPIALPVSDVVTSPKPVSTPEASSPVISSSPLPLVQAPVINIPKMAPPVLAYPASPSSVATASLTVPQIGVVDFWQAERMAERYRVLHRLIADGLLSQAEYDTWANQNAGGFLLLTVAMPPIASASFQTPRYEDLVEFLKTINGQESRVAAAERAALLQLLMPTEGARALKTHPPAEKQALQKWISLLDGLRDDGLLPSASIEAEKAAINENWQQIE